MRRRLAVATALAVLAASACTVGPRYVLPKAALISAPTAGGAFTSSHAPALSQAPPPDGWWLLYQDATLNGLVAKAFAANTDLRVAEANLLRSRALVEEVKSRRQPSLGANFDVGWQQVSPSSYLVDHVVPPLGLYNTGLSAGYDLDLFGGIHRAVQAAAADDEAIEAGRDLVRIHVAADTTGAYVDLCNAGAELVAANRVIALQEQSLAMTHRLIAGGRGVSLDAVRSREVIAQVKASIPTLEAHQRNADFRLATLTGRPPAEYDASLEQCVAPPRILTPLPVGDGATLLKRRPDVRAAERRLASSTYDIGVAVSSLYPRVSFGGTLGSTGAVANFLNTTTNRYGIGPAISWQLNQSLPRARIAAAKAQTQADLARFDGVVLNALREAESTLNTYTHDLEREQTLQDALSEASHARSDATRLQQQGRATALSVLDADRTAAAAEVALANQRSQVASDQVAVFLALGGGWQAPSVDVRWAE